MFADSTIFDIFDFKLIQGNPKDVLDGPNKVVLTRTNAEKYFGDQNPIGIRKVIGARVSNIVYKQLQEFAVLIVTATLFAWPAGYYIMNKWLQNFSYRIDMPIGVFIAAAFFALFFAMISVIFQSLKAASANPVDTLQHE